MILKNARIYDENFDLVKADITIDGEIISAVGETDKDGIDLSGCIILPGFIDIHTHGAMGGGMDDANEESLQKMSRHLARHGVTSFCPTSMTLPEEWLSRSFKTARDLIGREEGAYIQGINMEGPFISMEKKGAQCGEYIRKPDAQEFKRLNEICKISLVDVAPEVEGAFEFAEEISKITTVSAAHSVADYETATESYRHGFTHTTHLFNAMQQFSSRAPGMVGAVFDNDKVTAEIICDGFHVSPPALRTAFKMLGEDRTVIISDALTATGLCDGDYELGGQPVYVRDGKALLADGTIAASTSNLHKEFCNVISFGIPAKQAVKSCTINPAKVIGVDNVTGSIKEGKLADLLVLNEDLSIKTVIIRGKEYKE